MSTHSFDVNNVQNSIVGNDITNNYIGGQTHKGEDKIQQTSKSNDFKYDFGILLAKDKEIDCLISFITDFGYKYDTITEETLSFYVIHIDGKSVAFTYFNDMGFDKMKTYIKKFIRVVRPKFVTTIGICASLKSNLNKVLIFKASKYGDLEQNPTIIDGNIIVQLIPKLLCRTNINLFVDPKSSTFTIYTSTLPKPKEEEKDAEKKTMEFLELHGVDGIDMEIGAVFLAIQEWNQVGAFKVTPLVALKAVSDFGTKEIRTQNAKQAAENASNALILYIKWLIEMKLT